MNKLKKILTIDNEKPEYITGCPIAVSLGKIRHSNVHTHTEARALEVVICLEGTLDIMCNDDQCHLTAGQMYTINYDDIHCLYSEADNLILTVHFDLNKLADEEDMFEFSYLVCDDVSCKPFQEEYLALLKGAILSLAYGTVEKKIKVDVITEKAQEIVDYLTSNFNWLYNRESYTSSNEELNERLRSVLKYCTDNYQKKLVASKLARDVHINSSYFSQFFKKSPFEGFNRMISSIRCLHAQEMLITTDMTITTISMECGFSDERYFKRNFTELWGGLSPNQYRQWFAEYVKHEDSVEFVQCSEIGTLMVPYMAEILADIFLKEEML